MRGVLLRFRRVFFSFQWEDVWRVNQVRFSWVAKGNYENAGFADAAEIEGMKRRGDDHIKRWIDEQLHNTSVTCVLIGSETSESRWVKYEIQRSLEKGNGMLGVHIHQVKDQKGHSSNEGISPLSDLIPRKSVPSSIPGGPYLMRRISVPGLTSSRIPGIPSPGPRPRSPWPSLIPGSSRRGQAGSRAPCHYDWVDDSGYRHLGDWIEEAARQAGR